MSQELFTAYSKFSEAILEVNAYVANVFTTHEELKAYSPQQLQTLRIIKKNPAISQSEIADIQGVFKTAISNRIKKLEQDGLIAILTNQDLRKKAISITQKGTDLLMVSETVIFENLNDLLAERFTSDEIIQFTSQLDEIVNFLRTEKDGDKQ
ncbi:winged helix-turn-helix transcriptional regulator [Planococcus maritimus]|nr:MarR family transcriptional regulator [Planococcus sp. SK3692]MDE4085672.1 winged helix-turn-helix transcriptional regulator [Planococcus maritimus]